MDFKFSDNFGDDLSHASYFAALLVHEGTHLNGVGPRPI